MKIGKSGNKTVRLNVSRLNRHGLITGATGTGKTVTLHTLAENLSYEGVSVFAADVKGDLSGIAMRDQVNGIDPNVVLWDLMGSDGHPIQTTVADMGARMLSRMMGLTKVQEGVLTVAFAWAQGEGFRLHTLTDLQRCLAEVANRAKELRVVLGNITAGSVGAIQREITSFRAQGGDHFFGHAVFDVNSLIHCNKSRGRINVLAAYKLMTSPKVYSTFLLWLLTELQATLPEVGDQPLPKLVFFFDEAHLLFDGDDSLEAALLQTVRLIRSKGIGVFFVTQRPIDLPASVLAQLSNVFQHALRAYTSADLRAVRAAASGLRPNPAFNAETAITGLKIGQALVSTVSASGEPTPVEIVNIDLPFSRLGPITRAERDRIMERTKQLRIEPETDDSDQYDNEPEQKPRSRVGLKVLAYIVAWLVVSPFLFMLGSCAMMVIAAHNNIPR